MNKKCMNLAMAAFVGSTLLVSTMSAQLSGAIFTSLSDGATVNANNFESCPAVYLNGGPQNANSRGLPVGEYYFQVTNPSGSVLLSTTPAFERRVKVAPNAGGEGVISGRADVLDPAGYTAALFHQNGAFNAANGSTPVQLWHFDATPNNGGVYKVWLIPVGAATVVTGTGDPLVDGIALEFDHNNAKTDNFRCVHDDDGGGGSNNVAIGGRKYFDANANGVFDDDGTEAWNDGNGAPRVTLDIWITVNEVESHDTIETDSGGTWGYVVPENATFTVCEQVPLGYLQTGPVDDDEVINGDASADALEGCWAGSVTTVGLNGLDFGNVCLGAGGGKTLGYWSNKNGERTMNDGGTLAPELALLSSLNLRKATGADFDPGTYASFRTWILNATATNMAYMLSAQLAAMELNVEAGFVSDTAMVYAPGCVSPSVTEIAAGFTGLDNEFISIANLMNAANASLGSHQNTTTPHVERCYQERLKNALDAANNNLNFVQSGPCN